MIWDLFITFMKIGFVSFGGGYAMIPVIQEEVRRHGWMISQDFTNMISVAAMAPGPIATNSAIVIGFHKGGLLGAFTAAAGMVLPSLLIILIVGKIYYKMQNSVLVRSSFYGLRAIVTGLIAYAAIILAVSNGLLASFSLHTFSLTAIFASSLAALFYFRIHPLYVILLSGLVGAAFFG